MFLLTEDDIIIADPENEYGPLVQQFGAQGQVIDISPTSTNYINPMDINLDYSDDENPITLKSDFILSLCDLKIDSLAVSVNIRHICHFLFSATGLRHFERLSGRRQRADFVQAPGENAGAAGAGGERPCAGVGIAYENIVPGGKGKEHNQHFCAEGFAAVFENEYSGAFFNSAWRRFRKRNAFPNAITQNVEYLLDSVLASTMLSNSEYIVMLNQAASF